MVNHARATPHAVCSSKMHLTGQQLGWDLHRAGEEPEEPPQLCHTSSRLGAPWTPSWTTEGCQPGATLQCNHPWDGVFCHPCPGSHPAPKGFLFLLPCHAPSNADAMSCSLGSLGTARSLPSQHLLPAVITRALNDFLVPQPTHTHHGHRLHTVCN